MRERIIRCFLNDDREMVVQNAKPKRISWSRCADQLALKTKDCFLVLILK